MTYYIKNGEYFFDFPYLKGISKLSTLNLRFLLDKENIGKIEYSGFFIYSLRDLYNSSLSQYIEPTIIDVEDDDD
jgi:hypothetical protein